MNFLNLLFINDLLLRSVYTNIFFYKIIFYIFRPGDAALGPPPSGHTELPLCPVCLERMDESVDGILTILCNHSFHGSCLAKWADIRYFFLI